MAAIQNEPWAHFEDTLKSCNDFQLGRRLGNGSNCVVFEALFKGHKVAAKAPILLLTPEIYGLHDTRDIHALFAPGAVLADLLRELRTHSSLPPHRHICKFLGVVLSRTCGAIEDVIVPKYVLLSLASEGTLENKLKADVAPFQAFEWSRQIAEGVAFLHGQLPRVLHRDLKPANILIHEGVAKIADFGFARPLEGSKASSKLGTLGYMAPEILEMKPYDAAADVYSLAIMTFEIFGYALRSGSPLDRLKEVSEKDHPVLQKLSAIDALALDPSRRPSAQRIADVLSEAQAARMVELETRLIEKNQLIQSMQEKCQAMQEEIFQLKKHEASNLELTAKVENLEARLAEHEEAHNFQKQNVAKEAVEKIVEVPQVQTMERVVPVPQVTVQEVLRQVPRVMPQEVVRQVPVPQVQTVEKVVQVPQLQQVDKAVPVPQVAVQEVVVPVPKVMIQEVVKQVPVPQVQTVEKIVEVPQVQTMEKVIEVPQVQVMEKVVPAPQTVVQEVVRQVPRVLVQEAANGWTWIGTTFKLMDEKWGGNGNAHTDRWCLGFSEKDLSGTSRRAEFMSLTVGSLFSFTHDGTTYTGKLTESPTRSPSGQILFKTDADYPDGIHTGTFTVQPPLLHNAGYQR